MKPLYSFSLVCCCLLLGLSYHADQLTAKPAATSQPAPVITPFVPRGCECGEVCRCKELEAEVVRLKTENRNLVAELQSARATLEKPVVKSNQPAVEQVALAPASCPNGFCPVQQPAVVQRRVVAQPRQQQTAWYPGKNLGRRKR